MGELEAVNICAIFESSDKLLLLLVLIYTEIIRRNTNNLHLKFKVKYIFR